MKRTLVFSALAFASASLFAQVEIGWGEVDITPPFTKKVPLGGQYYQRLATGVHTPIAITAVAIRNGGEYFLTASFDNVSVREGLIDEIRAGVKAQIGHVCRYPSKGNVPIGVRGLDRQCVNRASHALPPGQGVGCERLDDTRSGRRIVRQVQRRLVVRDVKIQDTCALDPSGPRPNTNARGSVTLHIGQFEIEILPGA